MDLNIPTTGGEVPVLIGRHSSSEGSGLILLNNSPDMRIPRSRPRLEHIGNVMVTSGPGPSGHHRAWSASGDGGMMMTGVCPAPGGCSGSLKRVLTWRDQLR